MSIRATVWLFGAVAVAPGPGLAQDAWGGFYGGVSLTAARTTSDVGASAVHKHRSEAASAGVFAGYNFAAGSGLVWGPELEVMPLSSGGQKTDGVLGTSDFEGDFLLSTKVRAGYATDTVFVYGVAGLGWTDAGAKPAGHTGVDLTVGGGLGAGIEYRMSDAWSTRVEAMYYDLGGGSHDFNGSTETVDTKLTSISVGVTRRF